MKQKRLVFSGANLHLFNSGIKEMKPYWGTPEISGYKHIDGHQRPPRLLELLVSTHPEAFTFFMLLHLAALTTETL
jgi:hypothetical protein